MCLQRPFKRLERHNERSTVVGGGELLEVMCVPGLRAVVVVCPGWRPSGPGQVIPGSRGRHCRHGADETGVVAKGIFVRVAVIAGFWLRQVVSAGAAELGQILYDGGTRVVAVLPALRVLALTDPLRVRVMLALKSRRKQLIKRRLQFSSFSRPKPDCTDM